MTSRVISVVLVSHFTAALVALGMPPYFGLILKDAFSVDNNFVVGWFYVIPTLCTALAAPFWGRLADHYGRRWSLLRAQLGLALAFVMAGLANDAVTFAVALVLQGVLGGTFAASSAYLSTVAQGQRLAQSLDWMQGSARAAMVFAPVVFGVLMVSMPSQTIYLYMALLPALSAVLVWRFAPADRPHSRSAGRDASDAETHEHHRPWRRLIQLQFGFNFALVASFPYFIPWAQARTGESASVAGVLYSLPHALYLLLLMTPCRTSRLVNSPASLPAGLVLLALAYMSQATASTTEALVIGRLVMGLGMTICLFSLNARIASLTRAGTAGRTFGALDSAGKWAGVAAGAGAGMVVGTIGEAAPFWLGTAVLVVTAANSWRQPSAIATGTSELTHEG